MSIRYRNELLTINIIGLEIPLIIGVFASERDRLQQVVIDASFKYDASKAMQSDNEDDVVDYFKMAQNIKDKIKDTNYFLLERLMADVVMVIMQDIRIMGCKVTIYKPEANVSITSKVSR